MDEEDRKGKERLGAINRLFDASIAHIQEQLEREEVHLDSVNVIATVRIGEHTFCCGPSWGNFYAIKSSTEMWLDACESIRTHTDPVEDCGEEEEDE